MVRPQFLLSDLQRALGHRQRVVMLSGTLQLPSLRIEFMSFVQQTIVLGRRANFHQPNLITPRSAFEFCRDVQTITAVCFRNEFRPLFFLRPKLIIELYDQLYIGREQALDDVDAALLNTHARKLAGGQIDLRESNTPWGPRFFRQGNKLYQRSTMTPDLRWEVPQTVDTIDPKSPHYNAKSAYAKTLRRDGTTMDTEMWVAKVNHQPAKASRLVFVVRPV